MDNKTVIIILLLVAFIITGVYFLVVSPPKPFVWPGEEISLEKAKELAMWYARRSKEFRRVAGEPASATEAANLKHPYFRSYYFIYVWGPFGHADNRPFAVSQQGDVFLLPDEFNDLVKDVKLELTSPQQVQSLIDFYLKLNIVMPRADKYIILKDVTDIPGIKKQPDIIEQYREVVQPIDISENEQGWGVEFFTWRAAGGVLFRWELDVRRTGQIQVIRRDLLEKDIGDSRYII